MALICGVVFTNCAAKKKVTQQQPVQQIDPQQAKIDSMKKAMELRMLELELEQKEAEAKAAIEIANMQRDNAKHAIELRLEQKLYTPCIDESYDKHGEYLAGLGIADNQQDRQLGSGTANIAAISDITTRYIGVIKNGVSRYSKDVNTRNGEKIKEGELEGEATAIGKASIEKHAEMVCREFGQAKDGSFTIYVAVHVPIAKVMDDLQQQLKVLQVDADRARFRQFIEEELNKQAAEKEAEQQKLEELRKQQGL